MAGTDNAIPLPDCAVSDDDRPLDDLVEFYVGHSLAESSPRQCHKAEMRLQAFCEARGIEDKLKFPPPRVIRTICGSPGWFWHGTRGSLLDLVCCSPSLRVTDTPVTCDTSRLKLLLCGLSLCHTPVRSRLPFISLSGLGKLVAATSIVASHADAVRLRACFCLAFFGLFRASEVSTTKSTSAHRLLGSSLRLTRSGISHVFRSFVAMSGPPVTVRLSRLGRPTRLPMAGHARVSVCVHDHPGG